MHTNDTSPVPVLIPYPLSGVYFYANPENLLIAAGDFVEVSFGKKRVVGVVWETEQSCPSGIALKPLRHHIDLPPLPKVQRQFIDWVAHYTMSPLGAVLKMAMSVPSVFDPPKRKRKITPTKFSVPVVPHLSSAQERSAKQLCQFIEQDSYQPVLLDGVTGSGKTEVYFAAVQAALDQGRQVLVLLPEISLSAQFVDRFVERFGFAPDFWHSEVTQAKKRTLWTNVLKGKSKIVVGARSALFLPYVNLGLIIVDEEHDTSFKQEEGVIYQARDMAVVRAHLGQISVILASATPSLESVVNVLSKRYAHVHLPDRHGVAVLPQIKLVDLRADRPPRGQWISQPLRAALTETLERKEQALLFLNRRGYAPLTICSKCGYRIECPNCAAWLIDHNKSSWLQCHHCAYKIVRPKICAECGEEESLTACGPGVERIAEELSTHYPEARLLLMTSDTITKAKQLKEAINRIQNHEIDIIVGTQIIAKGHHFPMLTLVGVIDADIGLAGGDLRATEKTWQLLHQVSGRAGRAKHEGQALIQTWMPEHRVMKALVANDRKTFLAIERQEREDYHMPPFSRLAAFILSGKNEKQLDQVTAELAKAAPAYKDVLILGPAPAPLAYLRGRYRRRFLIRAPKNVSLQAVIRNWLENVKIPSTIKLQIDIDPYGFF